MKSDTSYTSVSFAVLRARLRRGRRVRVLPNPNEIFAVQDFGPFGPVYLIEPKKWSPRVRSGYWATKRNFSQIVEILRDNQPLPLP